MRVAGWTGVSGLCPLQLLHDVRGGMLDSYPPHMPMCTHPPRCHIVYPSLIHLLCGPLNMLHAGLARCEADYFSNWMGAVLACHVLLAHALSRARQGLRLHPRQEVPIGYIHWPVAETYVYPVYLCIHVRSSDACAFDAI